MLNLDERRLPAGGNRRPGSGSPRAIAAIVAVIATGLAVTFLLQIKWGIVIGLSVAVVVGLTILVVRNRLEFIQVVAFLIHFDGVGPGTIRMGRVVAAMIALVLLYKLLVERWRPPAVPTKSWAPVLAMFVWTVLSGAWGRDPTLWLWSMGLLTLAVLFYAASGWLVDSHEKIDKFLRAYWYGGLVSAGLTVLAIPSGARLAGFGGDQNFFAISTATLIPLTVYYRRNATTPRGRMLYTVLLLMVVAGAAGAGSRSGLIGVSIVIFATAVTRPGLSGRGRVRVGVWAILLALLAFIVLFFAHPANRERGFGDRGSGRLDFWTVTLELIPERPILGWGGGQLGAELPRQLPTTPGVLKIAESRDEVSSHNTWLDIIGDYGLIGAGTFVIIFIVSIHNLLVPRWPKRREISTTLFVMLLPLLAGMFLLPMINNKPIWSIIGLSAALQVPSWGTRWAGYFARDAGEAGSGREIQERNGAKLRRPGDPRTSDGGNSDGEGDSVVLARWDLRVSRRYRYYLAIGALAGAVILGGAAAQTPLKHRAEVAFIAPELDMSAGGQSVSVSASRLQVLHTLAVSHRYALEILEQSGVEISAEEIKRGLSVDRPQFAALVLVQFSHPDEELVKQIGPWLLPAFQAVIQEGQEANRPQLNQELRPMNPGERRYYDGDLFLPVGSQPVYGLVIPPVAWPAFVGMVSGVLIAIGAMLLQQRRPRVNTDDDFPHAVGMPLVAHVGGSGRRNAGSCDQYSQVLQNVGRLLGDGDAPRNILVCGPVADRATRSLAMGLASSLAISDQRTLLVDGQADRPLLSLRLGGWRRPGLADLERGDADLESVIRRVRRWRLPAAMRRSLRRGALRQNLRFIPAGTGSPPRDTSLEPLSLGSLDESVVTVLLAPPVLGHTPVAPLLQWADVVVYSLVEGRTVTFLAEDGAIRIATFSGAPQGVVLSEAG